MAGLVMLGLISLMIITLITMLIMRKGWKRILQTFLGFLGAIVLLNYYVVKTCGANKKDVELMKPQAEVITKYILENGIPESMAEIPNFPYQWDRCERESKQTEYCYFHIDKNEYRTRLYVNYRNNIHIKIYNKKNETGIFTEVVQESNGINEFKVIDRFKPYSTKNDGICNPMRM